VFHHILVFHHYLTEFDESAHKNGSSKEQRNKTTRKNEEARQLKLSKAVLCVH